MIRTKTQILHKISKIKKRQTKQKKLTIAINTFLKTEKMFAQILQLLFLKSIFYEIRVANNQK